MKTIIVMSDSHGRRKNLEKILPLFAENDYLVHLGDGSTDMRIYLSQYPEKIYLCKGNCDLVYGEEEYVLEVERVRILCCHGHKYGVKRSLYRLVERAKELDCDVALYGHTHTAFDEVIDGVRCINPGSLGDFIVPSYCYLVVHGKEVTATNVEVLP